MKIISFDDAMEMRHSSSMTEDERSVQLEHLLTQMNDALEKELTERQYQVVAMHFYQKMGVTQIARELHLNPSTVSRTLQRATQRLRHVLEYFV